jgi:hypothetical protein
MKKGLLVAILVTLLLVGGCGVSATTTASSTTTTLASSSTSTTTSTTALTTTTTAVTEVTRYQQDDPLLSYAGTWKTTSISTASGGSFAYADAAGCSVTIRFTGTHFAWIAKTSPVYGMAKVTLDGRSLGTVDLYRASETWQQKVWGTGQLKPGAHTVTIEWTGLSAEAATGTYIDVDAVDVTGVLGP